MLDLEEPAAAEDVVYVAAPATSARVEAHTAILTLPLVARKPSSFEADPTAAPLAAELCLQSFGGCMLRATLELGAPVAARAAEDLDSSPMIERADTLRTEQLVVMLGAVARCVRQGSAADASAPSSVAPVEPAAAGSGSRLRCNLLP